MTDCKDVKVHLRWKKPERRPLENHDTTNVQSRDSSADVVPSPMRHRSWKSSRHPLLRSWQKVLLDFEDSVLVGT